jgi:hypothetical protein
VRRDGDRPSRARPSLVMAVFVSIGIAAGCSSGPLGSGAYSTASSSTVPDPTIRVLPTAPALGTPGTSTSAGIQLDRSLLAVLPDTVDGLPIAESPETDADALANRALANLAESAVGAVAVDTTTKDLLVILVVRLRPDAMTEAGFRNWRDNYDAGACAGGGVAGNGQGTFGTRTAYVGTCGGPTGLRTYHFWDPDTRLLVSASSVGTRHLGEAAIATLRP